MKNRKRLLSLILVLTLMAAMIPATTTAASANPTVSRLQVNNVAAWMNKISADIVQPQKENGWVPSTTPDFWGVSEGTFSDASWSGACIMIPW